MTVPLRPAMAASRRPSDATAHPVDQRGGESRAFHAIGHGEVIVGHAVEGDALALEIHQRIGRARVAIAWLAHGAGYREPAAMPRHGDRGARGRPEGDRASASALE